MVIHCGKACCTAIIDACCRIKTSFQPIDGYSIRFVLENLSCCKRVKPSESASTVFFFFFFMVLCYAGSRFSSDTDRTPRSRWRSPVCSQRLIWRDWVQLIVEFVAVATILNIMSLPVKEQLCGLECPFLLQVPDQNSLQLCQGNEGPDHWQRTMHSESPTAQCATSLLSDTILWRRSRAHFLLFSRVSNPLFDQVHY